MKLNLWEKDTMRRVYIGGDSYEKIWIEAVTPDKNYFDRDWAVRVKSQGQRSTFAKAFGTEDAVCEFFQEQGYTWEQVQRLTFEAIVEFAKKGA